ncbi:hypothetical protein WN51_12814 [Melipona quadrifasciata]|uniref:Uncharacterized protein n=1 Tax=Melipona quadrifasciata TaxID=166423 RepID=A0A0M9A1X4_9HYME|nr:hypothetical protein WN51_12814 [Melipona quadrifasciata]
MSLLGGSRHLDTRSSCGVHAHPKCLTGCGYFLATRAFRAIVTRAATSREREVKGSPADLSSLSRCSLYSLLFVKVLSDLATLQCVDYRLRELTLCVTQGCVCETTGEHYISAKFVKLVLYID